VRLDELRRRLEDLYRHYDHRFVDPDPLELVRAQDANEDREAAGLIASALAYGNVIQIKRSVTAVLGALGERPARAVRRLDPRAAARRLRGFRHRFNDGRDVACLLFFMRQMLEQDGSIEGFFARGLQPGAPDVGPALTSFSARALALDHGGLYGRRGLPAGAGVRFFFPSPTDGSACKRLNLYLRWMARRSLRPGDPARRAHLRDRPAGAADALPFAGLADGRRHHATAAAARPRRPGQVRLRLPPHGALQEDRADPRAVVTLLVAYSTGARSTTE